MTRAEQRRTAKQNVLAVRPKAIAEQFQTGWYDGWVLNWRIWDHSRGRWIGKAATTPQAAWANAWANIRRKK